MRRTEGCPPPGKLLTLSRGRAWVQVDRAVDAAPGGGEHEPPQPWIVVLHGNVGSTFYVSRLARALCKAGRNVVRMDFYGRGWSSFCPR